MKSYFELFDLPVSFRPDATDVRRKFLAMSKEYHPDYFIQEGEEAQQKALETSAELNKGFKIFNNKDATIKYVLELKGLLTKDEKYTLPPAFLMEMMDINEAVADLGDEAKQAEKSALDQQLQNLQNEIYEPVANIIEDYKEGVTTHDALLQVKEYYFKKKYLARIYDALDGML